MKESPPRIKIYENACEICIEQAKRAPGQAVKIVKIPTDLDKNITHRYGENQFKLCKLPTPAPGKVLGLLGSNGIGKSTVLAILSGHLKPNLGNFENPPSWSDIIRHYRGSGLQNYFLALAQNELTTAIKVQRDVGKTYPANKTVKEVLSKQRSCISDFCDKLELNHLMDRCLNDLSEGELQRLSIACVASKDANVYIFDEPCSFLDMKQRLAVIEVIRSLCTVDTYVIVVEHDIAILDAMADLISCFFGAPGAYGIVTPSIAPQNSINQFIEGFFPSLNMRFRSQPLNFRLGNDDNDDQLSFKGLPYLSYESKAVVHESKEDDSIFRLSIEPGTIRSGEILGLVGENGTGKSTMLGCLAEQVGHMTSFKPQTSPLFTFTGSVSQLLEREIGNQLGDHMFQSLVLKPLSIDIQSAQRVDKLSGGEKQRLAICICLGKRGSEIFMLDEPSAGLDVEQRLLITKVIQRWAVGHLQKAVIIIDHDLTMIATMCTRLVCFVGKPGVETRALAPLDVAAGLNKFMAILDVTTRKDIESGRSRINRKQSCKDREQKANGTYYY